MNYNYPLIEGNRLLCPECQGTDLEPHITSKRHQIALRCRQCSRVTFLPLRATDIPQHDTATSDTTITGTRAEAPRSSG